MTRSPMTLQAPRTPSSSLRPRTTSWTRQLPDLPRGAKQVRGPLTPTDISHTTGPGGMTPPTGVHSLGTNEVISRTAGIGMGSRPRPGRTKATNRGSSGSEGILSTLGYPTFGIPPSEIAQQLSEETNAFCFRATAFTDLIGAPILHLTWEIDQDCIHIINAKFPDPKHGGDVLKEPAESVVQIIDRYDSHQTCVVFFLAAPPCPDFSQINSSAEGLSGVEGSKFTKYAELAEQIEALLGPRETRHLVENVVMQQRSEAQHISFALHSNPVVIDAADIGGLRHRRETSDVVDQDRMEELRSESLDRSSLEMGQTSRLSSPLHRSSTRLSG